MPKITPFLWFNDQAEEAMRLYCSIFQNSRILSITPGGPNGKAMTVTCELEGQTVIGLNAGPQFGWLKDTFGLSWQIIPTALTDALGDPDPRKSKRSLDAMLKLKKIDIKTIEAARAG